MKIAFEGSIPSLVQQHHSQFDSQYLFWIRYALFSKIKNAIMLKYVYKWNIDIGISNRFSQTAPYNGTGLKS